MVAGPTFHAWLELVVAARTDEQLRPKVTALTARFTDNVSKTFAELFPRPKHAPPFLGPGADDDVRIFARARARRDGAPGRPEIDRALEIWRQLAEVTMPKSGGHDDAT